MQPRSIERRERLNTSSSSCSSASASAMTAFSPSLMRRTTSLEDEELQNFDDLNGLEETIDEKDKKASLVDNGGSLSLRWLSRSGFGTLKRPPSLYSELGNNDSKNVVLDLEMRSLVALETSSDSSTHSSLEEEILDLENATSVVAVPPPTVVEPAKEPKRRLQRLKESFMEKSKPIDPEKYAAARVMTKTQEKWNAITMIPPSVYCVFYLMTAAWMNNGMVAQAQEEYNADPSNFTPLVTTTANAGLAGFLNASVSNDSTGCWNSKIWPATPAWPPLTVLAIFVGTCVHMPFSFLYHWSYAHALEGTARVNHWSRRMDQAMIHFTSAMYSYATSGSFEYFFACALFNLDCARRHFLPFFRPRSNQVRIGIAILAYSLPILRRGDLDRFALFWLIVGVSMWLFSQYPIGGYSHAAFHLVIGLLAPLLMSIAVELPASQAQLKLAAQCSVILSHQ